MQPIEVLTGTVERVTFRSEDSGYSVLRVSADGKVPPAAVSRDGLVTVVGAMIRVGTGERFEFSGSWINDSRYGMQFRAERLQPVAPSTDEGLIAYLSSGIVKGIGPKTAAKIVDAFGADTLRMLDEAPERLHEVRGLKKELIRGITSAWQSNRAERGAMLFLQSYGVSSKMAHRIQEYYGSSTVETVQRDPYTLADDVFGIGFMRADEIARSMGLPTDAPARLQAGIRFALGQMTRDGHTYSPRTQLIETAAKLLRVEDAGLLQDALDQVVAAGRLVLDHPAGSDDTRIYLPEYYDAEQDITERLSSMNSSASPGAVAELARKQNLDQLLARLSAETSITLTPLQRQAVRDALTRRLVILTGGPGTGKTTALRMVIHALEALDAEVAMACPTGRAAKRMSEATGREARTIHRLLGFNAGEGGFLFNEDQPLELDMLVLDESSMIDLLLFRDVLSALPADAHLLLVGDVDQLPSVGAGNVLNDLIASGVAHVLRLDTIFRQAAESHIVLHAHSINRGQPPVLDNQSADFFFFGADEPTDAEALIVDLVTNRLPKRFGVNPLTEIQVLSPMYRGPAGVNALNLALQQSLNGQYSVVEKRFGDRLFRVGDKVMQTRNNYELEVFNGDIGLLTGIDLDENQLEVHYDIGYVFYDFQQAEEIIHAYCISIHRSQGSEYPIVVIPVLTQHYVMLQRNLLYTAITRARRAVVLVGSRKAVAMAVRNNRVAERYSGLAERLRLAVKID